MCLQGSNPSFRLSGDYGLIGAEFDPQFIEDVNGGVGGWIPAREWWIWGSRHMGFLGYFDHEKWEMESGVVDG